MPTPEPPPGSELATVALVAGFLWFPLLLTWNIFLVAVPALTALSLGYLALRRLPESEAAPVRAARGRAITAMALGALPMVLVIPIVVYLITSVLG